MPSQSKSEIARALFEAYRTKNRAQAEAVLAEDFTFTSPYDDANGKAAYFERCWPNSERIESHTLEQIVESGERVFVFYLCRMGQGVELRNVETFDFAGGRIRAINVYFGAAWKDGVFQPQAIA